MMGEMRTMIEAQQRQNEAQQQQNVLLREALIAAQQTSTAAQVTATAAIERMTAPKEQRPGNISDFKRLNPRCFTGMEKPLEAEQWLTDMTNLLEATNVPEADQVKMAKIKLTDVAQTWWLAEEVKLGDNITWKLFSNSFYESFFRDSAKKDMEEQFIRLRQWDVTVDAYAADFRRLSRFASYMVADEKKRASRF